MTQRVLLVVPAICRTGGGVSESVRLLATALMRDGRTQPEVATLQTEYFEEDRKNWPEGIVIRAFRTFGPARFGLSPGLLWHLLRSRADIAHVHAIWMFHCYAVWAWHRLRGRRYVVTPHGMLEAWILARSVRLKAIISRAYQDRFLRRAAAIHVLTEKERQDVSDYGLATENTLVLPNFVQPPAPDPGRPPWWTPQMEGRRIYLFFGRIHEKKGWKELLIAWEQLCAGRSGFADRSQLVFCGWLDESPDFEPRVAALGATLGNVIYAGPQHGAARDQALAAADLFLLPSKSEGLPMVILEAWMAGVPTLMTEACNLSQGFDAGAALPTGESAEEIAEALAKAAAMDTDVLARMGAAGQALAARDYGEAAVVDRFVQLYKAHSAKGAA